MKKLKQQTQLGKAALASVQSWVMPCVRAGRSVVMLGTLAALSSVGHAAQPSPTAVAFSKQVMLGVHVSTLRSTEASKAEKACIAKLSDAMLAPAFDRIFATMLTVSEKKASDAHYDSVLSKTYFDWFVERAHVGLGTPDEASKNRFLSSFPVEEVRYMNSFVKSDVGIKVNSVLVDAERMQPVKRHVMKEIKRCRST